MWIRVTCPNGHRLKVETRILGRSNRCPKCGARISLWFEIQCPQGHKLKVRSRDAGRTGRCPVCHVEVQVPDIVEMIAAQSLLEEAEPASPEETPTHGAASGPAEATRRQPENVAAGGPPQGSSPGPAAAAQQPADDANDPPPVHQEVGPRRRAGTDSSLGSQASGSRTTGSRGCPSCRAQIAVSYRTCPYCRKYIGDYSVVGEAASPSGVRRCGNCGVLGMPGQSACGNCGFPLM